MTVGIIILDSDELGLGMDGDDNNSATKNDFGMKQAIAYVNKCNDVFMNKYSFCIMVNRCI